MRRTPHPSVTNNGIKMLLPFTSDTGSYPDCEDNLFFARMHAVSMKERFAIYFA